MTGQLMVVPTRVCTRMSKSASVGEAELQTGILMWCRPGKSCREIVVMSKLIQRAISHLLEAFNHTGEGDNLLHLDLFLDLLRNKVTMVLVVEVMTVHHVVCIFVVNDDNDDDNNDEDGDDDNDEGDDDLVDVDHLHLAVCIRGSVLQNLP